MSSIVLNGVEQPHQPGLSLEEIVATLIKAPRGVAVAVDREVIPRSEWASTFPEAGSQIEVVAAAAGG